MFESSERNYRLKDESLQQCTATEDERGKAQEQNNNVDNSNDDGIEAYSSYLKNTPIAKVDITDDGVQVNKDLPCVFRIVEFYSDLNQIAFGNLVH